MNLQAGEWMTWAPEPIALCDLINLNIKSGMDLFSALNSAEGCLLSGEAHYCQRGEAHS